SHNPAGRVPEGGPHRTWCAVVEGGKEGRMGRRRGLPQLCPGGGHAGLRRGGLHRRGAPRGIGGAARPARAGGRGAGLQAVSLADRKSTRLNSSHVKISYAVFCLKKKKDTQTGSCMA